MQWCAIFFHTLSKFDDCSLTQAQDFYERFAWKHTSLKIAYFLLKTSKSVQNRGKTWFLHDTTHRNANLSKYFQHTERKVKISYSIKV